MDGKNSLTLGLFLKITTIRQTFISFITSAAYSPVKIELAIQHISAGDIII